MWKFVLILGLSVCGVQADPATPAPLPSEKPAPPSKAVPKKKERIVREKENEGTEALHRFEADTVIKSKYHRGGQPMEVDPD